MEEKVVRYTTVVLLTLTIVVSFILLNFPNLHVLAQQKRVEFTAKRSEGYSVLDLMKDETEILKSDSQLEDMKGQLRLELPKGVDGHKVEITNQYIRQEIEIEIPKIRNSYFYDYPMIGSSDSITDITFETQGGKGIINITMDGVYEPKVTYEGSYLYLDFVHPKDLYDKIIVVDAGHGGNAPGATKQGASEKDIDLAIVKQLKLLLDRADESIGVYYTRTDDTNPSLESRAALANELSADLFLSVHNNSTASGRMSGISGTEVMYRAGDESGKSKQFAQICLEQLLQKLGSENKGVVAGDDIYIIREARMPVALVEVGFMTNQEELDKLRSKDYQKASAEALYEAIIRSLEEVHE